MFFTSIISVTCEVYITVNAQKIKTSRDFRSLTEGDVGREEWVVPELKYDPRVSRFST